MSETRTPGPWRVSPTGQSIWAGDQDGDNFERVVFLPEGKSVDLLERKHGPGNLAYIVLAVNAHEYLVEALRAVVALSEDRGQFNLPEMAGLARAALAKAEGK